MKDKIIHKATEMFLKLGFKSVTMDDIAGEMCISKKTIYKFFSNKELLIEEGIENVQNQIATTIEQIVSKKHNAIEENFEICKMFGEMFNDVDSSPIYQLKKHYPEIHKKVLTSQNKICELIFTENILKGISEGLYRENINVPTLVKFHYQMLVSINENTVSEKEIQRLEFEAMEYHVRALATPKGIAELEKQLLNYTS
jgi:TetR/AcrR family transcriptional regulator, biofilm operon repressor